MGRRKPNPLGNVRTLDFKDVQLLKYFVTERGRLIPRRLTGVTAQQQRQIAKAVKRARLLGLLPFLQHGG
ncbi:30S ribosomal protein S18 [Stigmatella aurantiaca]|uniref:Small ribosomal subunit protein bS18 n=1 Tax=Stigmatella aurantiaca (strain DW4/3-1) TaxID=378806 RepID=E3FKM5_STIAD|nr:30S ribosomal protein S18 [Stigmatella aurantiaca]ADO69193.1 30S ribosomal protein S18 [Stigmatella aurantiaca DW4/3-1]